MAEIVGAAVIELAADARKLKASIEDAKKSIRTLGEGQKEISKSAQQSIDRYIGRLQQQNATIGKSVRETELYKLALRGASNEQYNAANAALLVAERHKKIKDSLASVEAGFKAITLAAIGAATAYAALGKSNIDFADRLNDLNKSTGITVEDLAGLSLLAKQTGTDLDGLAKAINKMSVEMGENPKAFKELGITATDAIGRFKQLADVFNALTDINQRNALANKIFGRSWAELAPALSEGSKSIGEIVEKGTRLSGVTTEMAKKADEFNDKLEELKISSAAFGAEFLPILSSIVQQLIAARDGAAGLGSTLRRFFLVGGDEAEKPADAIAKINKQLTVLRAQASDFEKLGTIQRLFSADDIAIVNKQIDGLIEKRQVLQNLVKQAPLSAADRAQNDRELNRTATRATAIAPQDAAAAARRFLSTKKEKTDTTSTLRAEAAAQLQLDLEAIRKAGEATIAAYARTDRILDAQRAAALVTEREQRELGVQIDRDYYKQKQELIRATAKAQEYSLNQEIARLQKETFTGKTAAKDRLDNQRKIAEVEAKIAVIRADASASLTISALQEVALNKKRAESNEKLFQSYVDAAAAANEYIDAIKRRNAAEIAGIGMGQQFRDRQAGRDEIDDKRLQRIQELQRDLRTGDITKEQYDQYLSIAESTYAQEQELYEQRTQKLLDLQGDWVNGATEALQNYYDESRDIAGQTQKVFEDAFQSMEDALVEFTKTGKLDFKSLVDSIVADITRMTIKQSITGPLANLLGVKINEQAGRGSSGGSGESSLFSILGALGTKILGSFDTGIDYIPKTGIYQLHKGERVVNAQDNATGNWGGATIHINQSFAPGTDRRTVQQAAAAAGAEARRAMARNL